MPKLPLILAFFAGVLLGDLPSANAGSCCRYVVSGCGKTAKVCVNGGCSSANEKRAKEAYQKAYDCKSPSVKSHIGSCSNEKCALTL